jgi:hypothetical protein
LTKDARYVAGVVLARSAKYVAADIHIIAAGGLVVSG